MPMLACLHNVSWVVPAPGGKHQCLYCKAIVAKKDIYPKWDDLGTEYPDFNVYRSACHSVALAGFLVAGNVRTCDVAE